MRKEKLLSIGIEVGTIFYDSWGYEQTNIDFYQVVEVKAKTLKVRAINGFLVEHTGPDSGRKAPTMNDFKDDIILTKKIGFTINSKGEVSFHINSRCGWCSVYDQGAHGVYCSWGY